MHIHRDKVWDIVPTRVSLICNPMYHVQDAHLGVGGEGNCLR